MFWASLSLLPVALLATPPHILLVVVDDMGWNDAPWNNADVVAPVIDGLRSDGITLGDYHLYKVCSPSRASLMSGRYPNRAGLHNFIGHNAPKAVSAKYKFLAETMREGGYATHMVGKWHLGYFDWGYVPTGRGFESFFGYMGGAEDYFNHTHKGCPEQPSGPGYAELDLARVYPNKSLEAQPQYKDVYANDVFVPYTKSLIAAHPAEQPLFLFFPIQHVHEPLQVPERFKEPYAPLASTLPDTRVTLMGMVSAMDEALGEVVAALKERNLWESTLTIFTTDNGGNLDMAGNNYPLRGGKFSFWEGGNRGVAFVHSVSAELVPEALRGSTYRGLFHVADWYATICEAAGLVPPTTAIDSVSQWQAMRGEHRSHPRTEIVHETIAAHDGSLLAGKLRSGKWNLYYGDLGKQHLKYNGWFHPNGTEELAPQNCTLTPCLFNVEADASEHHDVAAKHPEVLSTLVARMVEAAVCPDAMCDLDEYSGSNDACDAFDIYGAYGPWADVASRAEYV